MTHGSCGITPDMRKVETVCESCSVKFLKNLRKFKASSHHYCSKECSRSVGQGNGRRTPNTRFRRFCANIATRNKESGRTDNLLADDLRQIWEKQSGVCPYTGWKLELPPNAAGWPPSEVRSPRRASIDRKNPLLGYTKDNVQFVSLMANFAKNRFTDDELLEFCRAVSSRHPPL